MIHDTDELRVRQCLLIDDAVDQRPTHLFASVHANSRHFEHSTIVTVNLFLANVKSTFTFAICCCLSVCCMSVCNARAPNSGGSNFPQYFYGSRYLAIHKHPLKILRRSSQRNPSAEGVKHKRGSKI